MGSDNVTETEEHESNSGTITLDLTVRHALLAAFGIGLLVGGFTTSLAFQTGATGYITADAPDNADGAGEAPSPQQDTQGQQQQDTVAVSDINLEDEPSLGSKDATVTVVEFSDYQCPFCRRFALNTFDQLKQNYIDKGKVRFVYKDFPLTQLGHNQAPLMARATQCAGEQDKYWELHDKLFNEQQQMSPRGTAKFSADKVTQWAEEIGLDMDAFTQCVDSDKYRSEVQNDLSEGKSLGVSGTPTFFIYADGDEQAQKLVGAQPYSRFQAVIEDNLGQ